MSFRRRYAGVVTVSGICIFVVATASFVLPPNAAEAWRLLRTADPRGGNDHASMSAIADMTRSDLDLAGLMLQCDAGRHDSAVAAQNPTGAEGVIVAVTPFPPRAKPRR